MAVGIAPGDFQAPRATYRLQLTRAHGFRAARELVPYLARLGISHCYFSPYLKTRPDSTHGYDVIDHSLLNPELGADEEHYGAVPRACRARYGPNSRHRAQSHRHHGQRQQMVARRSRERPGFRIRGLFRYRLAAGNTGAQRQGARPRPGRSIRQRAAARRANPAVRRAARRAQRVLLPAPLPARPGDVSAPLATRRGRSRAEAQGRARADRAREHHPVSA